MVGTIRAALQSLWSRDTALKYLVNGGFVQKGSIINKLDPSPGLPRSPLSVKFLLAKSNCDFRMLFFLMNLTMLPL